ncbi:MAG: protein kinase [Vicinamibacterales bacterium]
MVLNPGTRIGPYDIDAQIGVGGMGEVYRATDTNLKRGVAVKVLPASVANDPDRLKRFQREAEVLASLNHPNVAQIHGLEHAGATIALILELVEGPTLADRIRLGPIAVEETLPIARQIAEALEAAHDRGIIHRDLKPANIKVRDDGTVKVLDFGLAKAFAADNAQASVANSPTLSLGATEAGVILGTAAYMSPEQARGRTVDKRSDVWAFGCVLFEMLTGKPAFAGEELTDIIAAVVRDEPDWNRLPADTPASVRRLLRRSLEKDRKRRLADIADVRLELDDTTKDAAASHVIPPSLAGASVWRERVWAAVAIASLVTTAVVVSRGFFTPSAEVRVTRFEVPPPEGGHIEWGQPLSPDGRTLAFIIGTTEGTLIWIRPLDSGTARPVPGTERATRMFWSPDSQQIAFFVDGNLKKVALAGGPSRLVANGPFRDGVWGPNGTILIGGQQGRPLFRVSELGGEPIAVTALDTSLPEVSHDYPEFLPDGSHYLYLARGTGPPEDWVTYVGTLGSTERRPVKGIHSAMRYSPAAQVLLFLRGTTLLAQRFDRNRLELSGDPFPIAEQAAGTRVGTFSVSRNGTLAFIGGATADTQLTWFDRTGKPVGRVGSTAVYGSPTLSRDGRFVAFERGMPPEIWVMEVATGAATRFTSDRAGNRVPIWAPDRQRVAWLSNRGGAQRLDDRAAGLTGDDRLLRQGELPMFLSDWSSDGRYLAFEAGGDVWALPLADIAHPIQVTASPNFRNASATFSNDGRWVAYQSAESSGVTRSGEGDVYVQSFPDRKFKRQVSNGGGVVPHWSPDGKELFYLTPDGTLRAVPVTATASTLETGTPTSLFRANVGLPSSARYSVSSDGRFLMRTLGAELSVTVVLDWAEELERIAPR